MAANLPAVLAAAGAMLAAWISYQNNHLGKANAATMNVIAAQTNGLTAKLVDSADKEGYARGGVDQKAVDAKERQEERRDK